MPIIKILLQVGILWFLITFFTRTTDSKQSLREAWIVVFGMMIVNLVLMLLFRGGLAPVALVLDIAALYLLVDKVCASSRTTTFKICGWYIGFRLLLALLSALLL